LRSSIPYFYRDFLFFCTNLLEEKALGNGTAVLDNLPAADALTRGPRWLGCKIIWRGMNDEGAAYDLLYGKAIENHQHKSFPLIFDERGQVPGVSGMGTTKGVVVGPHISEGVGIGSGTAAALMDMKSKEGGAAGYCAARQACCPDEQEHTVADLVEICKSMQAGVCDTSPDLCAGSGLL
jgi:hypothetical protein